MNVIATSNAEPSTALTSSGNFLPAPRQIRFVSTDGQPHAKRRRINAACLTCRKRKTRCSGEHPQCKTCTDNGHVCAGYASRAQHKDDDKNGDESDNEDGSGTSSPRKSGRESVPVDRFETTVPPSYAKEKQDNAISAPSAGSGAKASPDDMRSPASNHTAYSSMTSTRNRVPYFRYFGPTAIVPGFKQMVVQVKDHRRSLPSASGESAASGPPFDSESLAGLERQPAEIPFYDASDPAPNAPLITQLCETFFTHLGCNYPFLQRERFLRDLEDKRVDAILVDAVCAVAARFSSDPLLYQPSDHSVPLETDNHVRRAFRGHPFAQRAMSAVIDTFSCPTMAVTQACLLLAYEEFGTDHDSGLWMYLGTAIRMAQDLGIQKLEGMQLEGRIGPTPKTAKRGEEGKQEEKRRADQQARLSGNISDNDTDQLEDRRASEKERIDTFWAIFFLDRAVSSGVGRPVTLRDKDIEISFPYRPDETMVNGYPHPFPPMIRIVHMYGRVADVLNNIKDVSQVTPDVLKRLSSMEKDLTGIYQGLSPKLHFNATNFQHYVMAEQGTNFILLHFWFHTLIVLVHQPTLLHSFQGSIQQLFPDSKELSMSSAKTIADILAFAELIDVKSFIGNPFTSQPMYVAACAFLAEAAAQASQPASRCTSPPGSKSSTKMKSETAKLRKIASEQKGVTARHTLLATAANQNYQRCYKALKLLDSSWAGCRYILTALDQKSKGLMDPLLFTSDDVDGEMPSTEPSFTTPGWRRSTPNSVSMGSSLSRFRAMRASAADAWSPKVDWTQAIGWSLTGMTDSPAPNLSFLYPNTGGDGAGGASLGPETQNHQTQIQHVQRSSDNHTDEQQLNLGDGRKYGNIAQSANAYEQSPSMMPPPRARVSSLPYDPVSTAEADLLLGLHSPYPVNSSSLTQAPSVSQMNAPHTFQYAQPSQSHLAQSTSPVGMQSSYMTPQTQNFNDMLIGSEEVDVTGQNGNFAFLGGDMVSWLEYLPQDVLSYFNDPQDGNEMIMPSGPEQPQSDSG